MNVGQWALGAIALLAVLSAAAEPPGTSGPAPIDAFFALPDLGDAEISPDGQHLAILMRRSDKDGQGGSIEAKACLLALNLATLKPEGPMTCHEKGDISWIRWVNNQRLVFNRKSEALDIYTAGGGLFAVDRNGANYRQLIAEDWRFRADRTGSHIESKILTGDHRFLSTRPGDGDAVVVLKYLWDSAGRPLGTTPLLLDTRSGRISRLVESAPDNISAWVLDPTGRPTFAETRNQGQEIIYQRSPEGDTWTEFSRFPAYYQAYSPFAIGFEGELYVTGRGGKDTRGLYRVDAGTRDPAPARLVDVEGFDFQGRLRFDQVAHRIIGVDFVADAPGTVWTDPAMKALQKKIDGWLPATVNQILCQNCLAGPYLLIQARSDRQPGRTLVYDRAQDKLVELGAARRAIVASQMGERSFDHFKARDGLEIPVYVTRPAGANGPTATVVYVHGGPWVRGANWLWSEVPQFLASRGYTVIEPEYRGSTGYGERLFAAGLKQWGLAMQDDVADSARWAIEKGYAAPGRIAIGGASYGGYATLMGLIRNPELFRAGFEWVGVTDINLMFTSIWGDFTDEAKNYDLPTLIGDPKTSQEQFAANSPLKRASEIRQPLLLAYGGLDRRVPQEHGTRFHDAVKATNHDVEWLLYPDEAHGWFSDQTRRDFWSRVERFLARTTTAPGPTASAAGSGAAGSARDGGSAAAAATR